MKQIDYSPFFLKTDFDDYSVDYLYPYKIYYRLMQEFSVDLVDENFVYLQISTKNTTTCDGVLDLLFTKPPQSDTCPSNRRTSDRCELIGGLPLEASFCREMSLSSKLWETDQSYESQERTALDSMSS